MFIRILKYSIKNILRNKFLSISSVLVLTLLMFFINILLVLHNTSFKLIDSINSKMSISLYLVDGKDKNSLEVIDLINDIQKISPALSLKYKSKDEVLEEMRTKDSELVYILEKSNPLPDTISISDIPLNDYEKINYIIGGKEYLFIDSENKNKDVFASYKSQYERISKVTTILKALGLALYFIILVFIASISIIIYSIIGNFIYYYREEIYITKLVGGNNLFISGPFSLQGIIYSVISFFLSALLFLLLIENLVYVFGDAYSLAFLFNNSTLVFLLEFLLFVIIGAISGFFSSKKYLK